MINVALKTEYSFKKCFGKISDLVDSCNEKYLGIADLDNTFGHVLFSKLCKEKDITPIFGVRIRTHPNDDKSGYSDNYWVYIAKNDAGLKEIYNLVKTAHDQFHYFPRLTYNDVFYISDNVFVICNEVPELYHLTGIIHRIDYNMITPYKDSRIDQVPDIAMQDNFYPEEDDEGIYHVVAGAEKRGDDYIFKFENRVVPMHIVNAYSFTVEEIEEAEMLASDCTATLKQAEMVKFESKETLLDLCLKGVNRLGLHLTEEYSDRMKRELALIKEKGYEDYFHIVADLMAYANIHMLVGPARGSSAGSLVCYLLNITKVDPIKFGLIFERFIDVNRFDLPDIDIDFPDSKRYMILDYLNDKYGSDNVETLANINRYKAKSTIDAFGLSMGVSKAECEVVKSAMIERSAGDARNQMCIMDTFEQTDQGKEFLSNHPNMKLAARLEGHANHSSKHAAGIIVSNEPLTNFGGVNTRDGVLMMDKKDAENIGLLKIDCLGLKTLSVLEDAAELIGANKDFYYDLPLDDKATIQIFKDGRLNGIFQFEGQALKMLNKSITVDHFDDIVIITSLARPGALRSGGAAKFAKRRNGEDSVSYFGNDHEKITKVTYGVMVFQEQMISLAKDIAGFTWMEVSDLRKATSKSLGDAYFGKYSERFIEGCLKTSGVPREESEQLWKDIQHAGSWLFNKSHAVSYGLISYFTAYMKAHHHLEFLAASLNHATDDLSALRMLREYVEFDGVEYTPVDLDRSMSGWTVENGKLLGGLTNIKGIGEKKAKRFIEGREGVKPITKTAIKLVDNHETPFDILFPTQHLWGHIFRDPIQYGLFVAPTPIREIQEEGGYAIIGRLMSRNLNDLNEYNKVEKRGYKLDEHTLYLNIILEDDHDSIMCSISRYNFDRLKGRVIAESAKIEKDWFLVTGKMNSSWRGINVDEILNLTNWSEENGN